jgi:hypothetical protein
VAKVVLGAYEANCTSDVVPGKSYDECTEARPRQVNAGSRRRRVISQQTAPPVAGVCLVLILLNAQTPSGCQGRVETRGC